jgi:hypothetical protein
MNLKTNLSYLSTTERSVLIGSLLGDGCLQKRGLNSYRYRVSQSLEQKSYVEWKYAKLKRLCPTTQPPKQVTDKKGFVTVEFYTSSGEYLKDSFELFYKQSPTGKFVKTITPELIEKMPMDPLLLSVWYMDDGSARNDCYAGNLATHSFSLQENHLLQDDLKKWGIDSNISKHSKRSGQYYLYIPSRCFPRFVEIIEPTVREIPSMVYKLNEVRKPFSSGIAFDYF